MQLFFANLIANRAAGLASRLAGSLAFAAATGFLRLLQIRFIYGLDMLHTKYLPNLNIWIFGNSNTNIYAISDYQ